MSSQAQIRELESRELPATIGSVYLMDLWSFIPYYMAHLCRALRGEGVDATLGSVQYHLDRDYFRNVGVETDPVLLDFGGKLKSNHTRRIGKALEYLLNLFILGLRRSFSRSAVLHIQFLPFLERGFPFEIWFLRWMQWRRVRIVYTVHNLADRGSRGKGKSLYAAVYGIADAIICHGQEAREKLIRDFGVPPEKIRIIPHGPLFGEKPIESRDEARQKLGLPPDEILVLCAGVVTRYKGIPFLLDAWKHLTNSGATGRLVIAGTGDDSLLREIREKVTAEHLESTVILWLRFIPVQILPLLYQAADILAYPYEAGTTSGALLTGLNYGKPFVTTRLPFFREHLSEGQNAWMASYGDVVGFSDALNQLITSPEKREKASLSAMQHHPATDEWRKIARATLECYRQLWATSDPAKE